MKPVLLAATLLSPALALAGCDDFDSPAELSRPQILAIQSEPASVALGGSAELTVLVADGDGPIENPEITWSLQSDFGLAPVGQVVVEGGRATYIAPIQTTEVPTAVSLEARLEEGGETLIGVKALLIGGPAIANPVITAITKEGTSVGDELVLAAGSETELAVAVESSLSPDATFAWYARPGTINEYRSSPTRILAGDELGEGWIFVVVRDRGGIAYHSVPTRVQ